MGKYESGTFKVGDQVKLQVDGEFRKQNARIHSAGHLLDIAMQRAGQKLKPGKGYHFVEGPYVEYIGVVPKEEMDELTAILNKNCADLIAEAKAA
jgi:Ser-tRNA(Ala) deacylase AlaX